MALTKTPIELSSTPGIVDNSNATAITIDSSENVGIGGSTITDGNLLNIQGSSASVNIGVVFNDTNTSKIFAIQNGGSALKFFDYTASAERMRILSTGGITFNGDTAQANALDDYEEGEWTMGIVRSSAATVSITNATGRYTKVGNLVTVGIYSAGINVSNAGGGTTDITGLPFTVSGGEKSYTAASFAHTTLFSTTYEAYPAINTTHARVTQVGSISNAGLSLGTPKYMMFSLSYFTDA